MEKEQCAANYFEALIHQKYSFIVLFAHFQIKHVESNDPRADGLRIVEDLEDVNQDLLQIIRALILIATPRSVIKKDRIHI